MDELQISGKRYISSRRIARENGYTADYIGQLIRGGKIVGQKVGRAWYVEAASFDAYLGGEGAASAQAETPQLKTPEQRSSDLLASSRPPSEQVEARPFAQEFPVSSVEIEKVKTISARMPEESVQESRTEETKVEEPAEEPKEPEAQPVKITIAEAPRSVPLQVSGLRYYADDEPLLPEISRSNKESRLTAITTMPIAPSHEAFAAVQKGRGVRSSRILALGALAISVLVISAVVSSAVALNLNIGSGNTASAFYTIDFTH